MTDPQSDVTRRFLSALYDGKDPAHYILIWTPTRSRLSKWFTDVDKAAAHGLTWAGEARDVYFGLGLTTRDRGSRDRCPAAEIAAIPGVWADVDYAASVHQKQNLPDKDQALYLIRSMPYQPTIIVHSGHGWHAYWLFKELWTFADDSERQSAAWLVEQWQAFLRSKARAGGWTVDSTHDLARILRLPGSYNQKEQPAMPVSVLTWDGPRLTGPMELEEILGEPPRAAGAPAPVRTPSEAPGPFVLDPAAQPPFEKFNALIANDKKFAGSFEHDRIDWRDGKHDCSASEYDMSMATIAFMARWTQQEVVDLLIASARKAGREIKTSHYYQRTLEKAKETADRFIAADEFNTLRASDDGALGVIARYMHIPITRIIKYQATPDSIYYLEVEGKGKICLGDVGVLIDQAKLRVRIAELAGIYFRGVAKDKWPDVADLLLALCEVEPLGEEADESGRTLAWVRDYLAARSIEPRPQANSRFPFIDPSDGATCIQMDSIKEWLQWERAEKLSRRQIAAYLRSAGLVYRTVGCRDADGKATTRGVWALLTEIRERAIIESERGIE